MKIASKYFKMFDDLLFSRELKHFQRKLKGQNLWHSIPGGEIYDYWSRMKDPSSIIREQSAKAFKQSVRQKRLARLMQTHGSTFEQLYRTMQKLPANKNLYSFTNNPYGRFARRVEQILRKNTKSPLEKLTTTLKGFLF